VFSSLRVITPPAPLASLDQVRRHCRVDSTYDDDLLASYLVAATEWAERYCNRAFLRQTLLYSITNAPAPTTTPYVPVSLIVFPLNWPPYIPQPVQLPRAPCVQLLEVLQGPVDQMEVVPPDHYIANLGVEPARVMMGPNLMPVLPASSLSFKFLAGEDDVAQVPATIRVAVLQLAAFMFEGRGDTNAEEPTSAWRLLAPHRLWQFSG